MIKAVLFISLLAIAAPTFAQSGYSSVISDLPLMAGMTEMADQAIIFDKPGGRIVETSATTTSTAGEISIFYAGTLPPLGWTETSTDHYRREGENLSVTITPQDGKNLVQFKIAPQDK